MNPEEKPPSSKTPSKAWGNSALCAHQNFNYVHLAVYISIVRTLALTWQNKYIFHGIECGEGISGNYFGMIAVTLIISDDIIYRVVDRL